MADPSAITAAIDAGRTEELARLLAQDPSLASTRTEQGISLLLHALYRMQTVAADRLQAAGAPLDLFDAAAVGDLARLTELVGAEPDAVHAFAADGFQALHLACFFRQDAAAALLLERGARVDEPTRNALEVLPLHSAVASRGTPIATRLLAAGADVDARQASGHTPLMGAAHAGARDLVELLLASGADTALEREGQTAADHAREAGHTALAELLTYPRT